MTEQRNPQQRRGNWLAWLSAICCTLLFTVGSAEAQQWKYVYGVDSTVDWGENRVIPVLGDCTKAVNGGIKGYIAVGTTLIEGLPQVYVVRTNNNGSRAWEKIYDIQDDDEADHGWSIVELDDGSGFAVTGHTFNESRAEDVFIMKIDCSGNVVWTETYGTADHEFAHDIIEAETGDATLTPPTAAGDLIVAGFAEYSVGENGYMDAYMLRVTSAGTLIWNRVYDTGPNIQGANYGGQFHALTEASPVGAASTGDIIAVGWVDEPSIQLKQGLIVRVDGDDGTTGNTTRQRGGHFGGSVKWDGCDPLDTDDHYAEEFFYSVTELSDTNEVDMSGVPNVVVVGYSNTPGKEEIYAVSLLGGDPCVVGQERLIGNSTNQYGLTCGSNEIARCVREVDWEMGGSEVSRWDLAITGRTDIGSGDVDVFLLTIDNNTLLPVTGGIEQRFGQTGTTSSLNEIGNSLYPVDAISGRTEGFIICGSNQADPMGVNDPEDMYLIKTNSAGIASSSGDCEDTVKFNNSVPDWDSCVTPKSSTYGNDTTVTTTDVSPDSDDEICTGAPSQLFHRRERHREPTGHIVPFLPKSSPSWNDYLSTGHSTHCWECFHTNV